MVYLYWSITTLAISAIGPLIIAGYQNKSYWVVAILVMLIGAWGAKRTEGCE